MGRIILEDSTIFNNDDSYERIRKEKEYLNYITEHINFVKRAYVEYMVPLLDKTCISQLISDNDLKDAIEKLSLTIETHDASKFSDSEFDGYRMKYYPTVSESTRASEDTDFAQTMEDRYNDCWEHHYQTNEHHPEYWYDFENKVAKDMRLQAIIEMLCDWGAMSLKFNSRMLDWWEKDPGGREEKEKIMSENTIKLVDELMYNVLFK